MSGYQAVVFDMDGVLVDSEPAFFDALNVTLAPTGKQMDWERYQDLLGSSTSNTWRRVVEMLGIEDDPQRYAERFNGVLIDILSQPRQPLPGVRDVLARLTSDGVRIGLATASRRPWVEALMAASGLPLDTFTGVAWREMVERNKPAPDLYLKAAELIDVAPGRCLAVEDTEPGVASAKAAGMHTIQMRSASTALPPIAAADLVLDTLEQFPFELLAPVE